MVAHETKLRQSRSAKCVAEGRKAEAGTRCPYGMVDIMERCAWLAGHYDQHGKEAWEKAR